MRHDVAVIGGGIVGLATAWQLTRTRPGIRVVLLEKEDAVATHQTGRNSGVIHTGIYYKPGSLKAENCRRGKAMLEAFCRTYDIPHETCGKVIVALDPTELPSLMRIHERAAANGVACELIAPARLRELEPHAQGVLALHVPGAGIVEYVAVAERLRSLIEAAGGEVRCATRAQRVHADGSGLLIETTRGEVRTRRAVNCSGLYSDRVAAACGLRPPGKIIPFRGEYFELTPDARLLCRNLIYPVPDPKFPFLGVHFTRMIGGGVECGPNAVLAFAREGYTFGALNPRDLAETLTYPAFWKIAAKYWRTGMGEMWRSLSRHAFVRALQRLVPDVREEHLVRAPAGVRAQALARDGTLMDDFVIVEDDSMVHVLNAPSPAATSSLAIGERVAGVVCGGPPPPFSDAPAA